MNLKNFIEFPIEIQILILSFCSDNELLIFSKSNEFFYKLIKGKSLKNENKNLEQLDDDLYNWHELLWKLKLLQLFKNNKNEDILLLENITKNYKHHYFILNNLVFEIPNDIYKQEELNSLQKKWTYSNYKKSVENLSVETWLSFRSSFQMSRKYLNPKLRGFEIIIDKYNNTSNSWVLVIGVGLKTTNEFFFPIDKYESCHKEGDNYYFNADRSITEFVKANKGVGFLSSFLGIKTFGEYFSYSPEDVNTKKTGVVKGSKLSCLINFEEKQIYYFVDGIHKVTVLNPFIEDDEIYYPIVSLSSGIGVTISSFPEDYLLKGDVIEMDLGKLIRKRDEEHINNA
ncbi:hypothetical protein ABK040_008062 [Willaertia magna]